MSEPIDPEWLQAVTMILKDADVRRAKLGDVELEFAAPTAEAPKVQYVQMTGKTMAEMDPSTAKPKSGYAALFGDKFPKFEKPQE